MSTSNRKDRPEHDSVTAHETAIEQDVERANRQVEAAAGAENTGRLLKVLIELQRTNTDIFRNFVGLGRIARLESSKAVEKMNNNLRAIQESYGADRAHYAVEFNSLHEAMERLVTKEEFSARLNEMDAKVDRRLARVDSSLESMNKKIDQLMSLLIK